MHKKDQVAILSDIICPADERGPAATDVGVPDVIDEWVSAPYSSQQRDRVEIINGLQWLDDEAAMRFGSSFVSANRRAENCYRRRHCLPLTIRRTRI